MVHQAIRNKRQGKAIQKKIAVRLGGKNVGTIEGQDIDHPVFSGEVKHRKSFAGDKFMEQAVKNCPNGKVPIVIVHTLNKRLDDALVMMKLTDWEEWYGKLKIGEKK